MGGKLDCHRTKGLTRMGSMGGKLDCHRTKCVTRKDQWEEN